MNDRDYSNCPDWEWIPDPNMDWQKLYEDFAAMGEYDLTNGWGIKYQDIEIGDRVKGGGHVRSEWATVTGKALAGDHSVYGPWYRTRIAGTWDTGWFPFYAIMAIWPCSKDRKPKGPRGSKYGKRRP